MPNRKFAVHLVSPDCFPWDPRHEQMRTRHVRQAGRVFGNKASESSRLLRLPDEILCHIVDLVAAQDRGRFLSSFALASRECRQLARPHQFADIWISRWGMSRQLLNYLKREVKSKSRDDAELPIGDCVRSLTIAVVRDIPDDTENQMKEEWEEYWQTLIDDLAEVLETGLPNLDRVFWADTADLQVRPRLLPAVLQHVRTAGASVSGHIEELYFEDYKFLFDHAVDVPAIISAVGSPLEIRSLAFGFDRVQSMHGDPFGCTAYFAETLLRRCAPTLESLVWNGQFAGDWSPYGVDGTWRLITFRDGPVKFSKLRKFWSSHTIGEALHPSVLECFLAAPCLESFSPSEQLCSIMLANGFADRFPLPKLRTFAVSCVSTEIIWGEHAGYLDTVLSVANRYASRIEELFIYLHGDGAPDEISASYSLDTLVSHLSSDSFSNLRFLCFSWVEDPELQLLRAIGSHMHALEELSFGFRPEDDTTELDIDSRHVTWPDPDYPPCHKCIIAAISPLVNLVRLGVFGDEYVADWSGGHWAWHRFYKENVWFHQGRCARSLRILHRPVREDIRHETVHGHTRSGDRAEDWMTPWLTDNARAQRHAVREIAAQYAEALPKLEEFMSGRVLVKVVDIN